MGETVFHFDTKSSLLTSQKAHLKTAQESQREKDSKTKFPPLQRIFFTKLGHKGLSPSSKPPLGRNDEWPFTNGAVLPAPIMAWGGPGWTGMEGFSPQPLWEEHASSSCDCFPPFWLFCCCLQCVTWGLPVRPTMICCCMGTGSGAPFKRLPDHPHYSLQKDPLWFDRRCPVSLN